ncbi:response regulator [Pseudocolwellia agarivorans]|uniref:response regulator n=1 Tax=Pseudocolwellia agarivorans TaxID=1911682 RepID=UPI0009850782|nr:response regulator [Pseudocolwellia agarivorans]
MNSSKFSFSNIYIILFLFLFTAISNIALSIEISNKQFSHFSLEDGLSQATAQTMLYDSQGFLWVGTTDGLNKYDGYQFKVYRHNPDDNKSISSNDLISSLEDSAGNLWFGTNGQGITLFDKKTEGFTHFKFLENESTSLSHGVVKTIAQDKKGGLWFGTKKGLNHLVRPSDKFIHFNHPLETGINASDLDINYLLPDNNKIWIATANSGLFYFDLVSQSFTAIPVDNVSSTITSMVKFNGTQIMLGTDDGVAFLDINALKVIAHKPLSILKNQYISSLLLEGDNLWIGTKNGGYVYNVKSKSLSHFTHQENKNKSLSHAEITTLTKDRFGGVWVGTFVKGLNRFDRSTIQFNHSNTENTSLSSNIVLSFLEKKNRLLIGTYGGGLNIYDRKSNTYELRKTIIDNTNSISSDVITALVAEDDNTFWVGTIGGGVNKFNIVENSISHYVNTPDNLKSLSNNNVLTLFKSKTGELWVGTWGGGLNRFDSEGDYFKRYTHEVNNKNSISDDSIWAIYEDNNGFLWLGTESGGLNKFDPQTNIFTHYLNDVNNKKSLSHNYVLSILQAKNGTLWIGTKGGLNKFDPISESFIHYREKDGLANDSVVGIIEDLDGNLWLSTNKGLSKFNPKTERFKNYDNNDGVQHTEFNALSYYKSKRGEVFFGGVNGYNHFYPENIKDDTSIPQVVLTDFFLLNKPVRIANKRNLLNDTELNKISSNKTKQPIEEDNFALPAAINELDELTLSYHEKVIAFEFAALHFAEPMNNQYAYKLEGFDSEWIYTDAKNRRATYTNIPAGNYVFKVKASNGDGYWNEEGKTIKLNVLPPLWETWWAYTLYLIAILGIIFFLIYRQHIKHLREQALNIRLTRVDKLKDEFLANTSHELRTPLNGIIGLAESLIDGIAGKLPDKATHDLSMVVSSGYRLSNLINDILDFSKLKNHSLTLQTKPIDLCSMVNVVIALSKPTVKNKKLLLVNNISADFPPVMADEDRVQQILFNLIGNAIKYSLSGEVTVSANVIGKKAFIRVKDTGIGIEASELESLFDSFKQAEHTELKLEGGTGLGLAVTKQLVELHGGSIEVSSIPLPDENHGSCFSFYLNLASKKEIKETEGSAVLTNTLEQSLVTLQPLDDEIDYFFNMSDSEKYLGTADNKERTFSILIVDDDPINRQVLANHLIPKGYQLTQALGGQEALDIIEKESENLPPEQRPFDLVLLDVMMPKVDGYQVCQKIRETYSVNELPIIFLTAKNQVADLVESFSAGGNDYLTKPISKYELLSRVETHLKLLDINRNLERQVKERTLELEHAMEAKSDFLAKMSHEIRTPMNAIIGLSHITLKTELDKNQRDLLEKTQDASHALLGLINDILDFSKIEAGKMGVECIPMTIDTLIRKANNICALRAHAKELELVVQVHKNVPEQIKSDPVRLQQILVNLIGNAIKFTEKGHVHIEVKQVSSDRLPILTQPIYNNEIDLNNLRVLEFSVSDTGIGISKESIEQLFKSFSQADSSITRKYGGSGLGLSICKELTSLMGGDIWVESEEGKGSKFSFTIVFEALECSILTPQNLHLMDELQILVVDDNPICLDIISDALCEYNCNVSMTNDAISALQLLKERNQAGCPFDIVITDWKMPDVDGIEFAQLINQEPDYYHVKAVLMVTAFDKNKAIPMAQFAGIDAFIEKPVTPTLLLESILNVLKLTPEPDSNHLNSTLNVNYSNKHILLVEDNELNQQVVLGFLEETQVNIDIADNGKIALEKLANKAYDLVFMDVQMPVMDGITATKEIRLQEQFKDLPIIAMTAHVVPEELNKCFDAGMNEYFTKPIDPKSLITLLAKCFSVSEPYYLPLKAEKSSSKNSFNKLPCRGKTPHDQFIKDITALKEINATKALTMMEGREEIFKKIVIGFYHSASDTMKLMETQFNDRSYKELYITIHSLKSNAAYIGAYTLSTLADKLEVLIGSNNITPELGQTDKTKIEKLLNQVCAELNLVFLACSPVVENYVNMSGTNSELLSLQDISRNMLTLLQEENAEVEDLLPAFIQSTRHTAFKIEAEQIVDYIEDIEYSKAITSVNALIEKITQV